MAKQLKANGRMASIMPHGVLFRGGEEKEARKQFIDKGWLDAVIGLPPSLFYGTGIPACILVMNKEHAAERDDVLFINADREYREGKAQNFLRPEDMAKIVHVYRERKNVPGYARVVPCSEIKREDYNCNIRRYVDNAPPPEPQDVRAHIHGGVPTAEVDALKRFWRNYPGLREDCFVPRSGDPKYCDFAEAIGTRRDIAGLIREHDGVTQTHAAFMQRLDDWWSGNLPTIQQIEPGDGKQTGGNVYAVRRALVASIDEAFANQTLLNDFQLRGAMANAIDGLKVDLKSIAASGWGPELIPDDDILQSQFPELIEEMAAKRARIDELNALFTAADEEDFEDEDGTGVLGSENVSALREDEKAAKEALKRLVKKAKDQVNLIKIDLDVRDAWPKGVKKGDVKIGGTQSAPDFQSARRTLQIVVAGNVESLFANPVTALVEDGEALVARLQRTQASLAAHKALEDEVKALKAELRTAEKKKDELVEQAREKIGREEAREEILKRFHRIVRVTYRHYLEADRRAMTAAIENLHDKYAVTLRDIEDQRTNAASELDGYLKALGYA